MDVIWNALSKAKRNALLIQAGYNRHYSSRVWNFLPAMVREDVSYVYRLKGL